MNPLLQKKIQLLWPNGDSGDYLAPPYTKAPQGSEVLKKGEKKAVIYSSKKGHEHINKVSYSGHPH